MIYIYIYHTTAKHIVWIIETYALQRDSDTLNNVVTFFSLSLSHYSSYVQFNFYNILWLY